MRRSFLIAVAILAFNAGCASPGGNDDLGDGSAGGSLRDAPRAVVIEGTQLTLQTYVWRDFMPIAPPDGQPMRATVQVVPSEGPYPEGVEAMRLWVIHGEEVWETSLERQSEGRDHHPAEYSARAEPGHLFFCQRSVFTAYPEDAMVKHRRMERDIFGQRSAQSGTDW